MSLLTICQSALREVGEFSVPSSIIGNTDPTAVQLLALAQRSAKTLALDHKWQVLLTTYTFPTVAATATYALPSDFHRFANLTFWDRTNYEMVRGPVSAIEFERLRSGNMSNAAMYKYFRLAANLFSIYPTPTAVETIAYQYYSKYFITNKAAYSDDADAPLLDEDLLTIDLRWRFLQAKGADFAHEKAEAIQRRDALLAKDGGRDMIQFGGPRVAREAGNIPDTGFGS